MASSPKASKPKPYDKISNRVGHPDDAAWRAAYEPLDNMMCQMEAKWGSVGRLMRLVTPDTAAKFASAQFRMDDALDHARAGTGGYIECAKRASIVMRGLSFMNDEAVAAGQEGMPPILSYVLDGKQLIICAHETDTTKVAQEVPGAEVWSVAEISRVLKNYKTLTAVKLAFPGAVVTEVRPEKKKVAAVLNDDLPF